MLLPEPPAKLLRELLKSTDHIGHVTPQPIAPSTPKNSATSSPCVANRYIRGIDMGGRAGGAGTSGSGWFGSAAAAGFGASGDRSCLASYAGLWMVSCMSHVIVTSTCNSLISA